MRRSYQLYITKPDNRPSCTDQKQASPDATTTKCIPPPLEVNWSGYDLCPWKPVHQFLLVWWMFMPKFHYNPSTKYRAIASREISVNGQPQARPENHCWRRHKKQTREI